MIDFSHSVAIVAVVAAVTAGLRFFPFLVFGGKRKTPEVVSYLGVALPPAIIAMLVVYCFRHATPLRYPFALPELIAGVAVAILHAWKGNMLLSVGGGTLLYMALLQRVFV